MSTTLPQKNPICLTATKDADAPAIAAAVVATELTLIMTKQSVQFNLFKCLQPSQDILKHDTVVVVAVFIIMASAAASLVIITCIDRRIRNWRHANIAGHACICSRCPAAAGRRT